MFLDFPVLIPKVKNLLRLIKCLSLSKVWVGLHDHDRRRTIMHVLVVVVPIIVTTRGCS